MKGLDIATHHRVYAMFALHAIAMGSIFPRIPDIKDALGVDAAALGLVLVGVPIGTLLALTFANPLIERIGFRRVLLAAIPSVAACYASAVWVPHPVLFFLVLIPAGALIGCTEIIVNVEADRTEAQLGRRIMNRSHSFWSFGFFIAGLLGAALAHLGVSPALHLSLVLMLVTLSVVFLLGGFVPAPSRPTASTATPRLARPTAAILILVGVTFSAMLMEGAGLEWSALYMSTVYGSSPFLSGFAVATVALSQAIGRFFADAFVDRYSPTLVGRSLLCCLGAGLFVVLAAWTELLSLIGFAMIGFGSSVIFPLAMSAAAQRTDRPATVNVAALSQLAFLAFLLGPPLLGHVAEYLGLPWVFGLGIPLVVLSLVTAGALDSARTGRQVPERTMP